MVPVMHVFLSSEHAEQLETVGHSTLHGLALIESCPRRLQTEDRISIRVIP
jgi:hypothetical protein